ncbi:MAG: tetratricopeptide repeat protein [Nitrospirota bacterium]
MASTHSSGSLIIITLTKSVNRHVHERRARCSFLFPLFIIQIMLCAAPLFAETGCLDIVQVCTDKAMTNCLSIGDNITGIKVGKADGNIVNVSISVGDRCAFAQSDTIYNTLENHLLLKSSNGSTLTASPGSVFRAMTIDKGSEAYYQKDGEIVYAVYPIFDGFFKVINNAHSVSTKRAVFSVDINTAMDNITFSIAEGELDILSEVSIKVGMDIKGGYRSLNILSALDNITRSTSCRLSRDGIFREFNNYIEVYDYYANQLADDERRKDFYAMASDNNNIGNTLLSLAHYDVAFITFVYVLRLAKNIDDRQWQGIAFTGLGNVWLNRGDCELATDFYETALDMLLTAEPSSDVAAAYDRLGVALSAIGKYDKAIESYQKALNIRLEIYKAEPRPDVAHTHNDLGIALAGKEEYDKAIKQFETALEMRLKVYQTLPHPDVAASYNNLGEAWRRKGKYDLALEFLETALKMKLKIHQTAPHTNVADTYINLGLVWDNKGKYDKAIEYYKKALVISLKNNSVSDVAATYRRIGDAWAGKEKYGRAIRFYNKALKIFLKIYKTAPNPKVAQTYNDLGIAWAGKKKYDRAIRYFNKSLQMRLNIYENEPHQSVAVVYNNMGLVWAGKKKYDRAIGFYEQALETYLKVYKTEPHLDTAYTFNNLGEAWYHKRKYDLAIEYYEKSVNIFEELGMTDHSKIRKCKKNLERAIKSKQHESNNTLNPDKGI